MIDSQETEIEKNASNIASNTSSISSLTSSVNTALASKENLLSTQDFTVDNITVEGSSYYSGTLSCSRSGYTALGIVGYYVHQASSSGTNNSRCFLKAYLSNSTTITYQIGNYYTNDAKVMPRFVVLYVANGTVTISPSSVTEPGIVILDDDTDDDCDTTTSEETS